MPDENIGKNLEQLCIRRGNLKYFDRKIGDTNPKKVRIPKLVFVIVEIPTYAGSVGPDFKLLSQPQKYRDHKIGWSYHRLVAMKITGTGKPFDPVI